MRRVLDSLWVRHPRIWLVAGGLIWVGILALLVLGRDPPTEFFDQRSVPSGAPGQTVTVTVPVKRNLDRLCSVDSSRTFFDSNHAADTLSTNQHISAEGLALREKANPGKLVFNVPIPLTASPGMAKVITENQYFCPFNPTTWFKRIDDAWESYILVTPKVSP